MLLTALPNTLLLMGVALVGSFSLGILVALVKIAQLATVIPDIGMYAVGVLVVLLCAIAVTFDPRVNDQDLDSYAIAISGVDTPPHGTTVVNAGVSVTYTPNPGYFGADSFLYAVTDGHNGAARPLRIGWVAAVANHVPRIRHASSPNSRRRARPPSG